MSGVWKNQAARGRGPASDPEASEFHLSGSEKHENCGTELPGGGLGVGGTRDRPALVEGTGKANGQGTKLTWAVPL